MTRIELALETLSLLRDRLVLTEREARAMDGALEAIAEVVAAAEADRTRAREKKRRQRAGQSPVLSRGQSGDKPGDNEADIDGDGTPQTPRSDEDPPLNSSDLSDKDPEKGEGNTREADAATAAPVPSVSPGQPKRIKSLDHVDALLLDLVAAFERVVHDGKKSVPLPYARAHLLLLLPVLTDRSGAPVALFEETLRPYHAEKRAHDRDTDLEWFCRDFAKWADRRTPPKPVVQSAPVDEHTRRLRDAQSRLRDTEALLQQASEEGKPALERKAALLREDIARLEQSKAVA